jgi:hypothetical protein
MSSLAVLDGHGHRVRGVVWLGHAGEKILALLIELTSTHIPAR